MPQTASIRALTLSDAAQYRAFRLRALREHADAFTSGFAEESQKSIAYSEQRIADNASSRLWGAFAGPDRKDMAGMVGLSLETRRANRHKGHLVSMYVAPEFSGKGLGRTLVDTVLFEARQLGLERLVLTVTDGNQSALALYTRAGFTAFGTEPDAIRVNGRSFGKTHMSLFLDKQRSRTS